MTKYEKLEIIKQLQFTEPVTISVNIKQRSDNEPITHSAEFRSPSQLLGFMNTLIINLVYVLLHNTTKKREV